MKAVPDFRLYQNKLCAGTRFPLLISQSVGLSFCALAWFIGLLDWRTAAKLAGWWCLMSTLCLVGLSALKKTRMTPWVLFFLLGLFALDIGVQGVIRSFFGSSPTPSLLVEALANTNSRESMEFIREHWRSVFKSVAFAVFILWAGGYLFFRLDYQQKNYSWFTASISLLSVIAVGFNPTMLRQNPLTRWPVLLQRHIEVTRGLVMIDQQLNKVDGQQEQWQIKTIDSSPRTVVLVIGESGNRDNWGLYGYPRDTTAPLASALHLLHGQSILFKNALSSDAFTIPSLTKALTPATKENPDIWKDTPAITQMARKTGFSVAWLSNQTAQEGWFDGLARRTDFSKFINNGNWRDSSSTDYELIPVLKQWLSQQKAEKEFVVIHLMGQHFYYNQRCPKDTHPFSSVVDEISLQMDAQNRLPHIKIARDEYDNAIYCGSEVLAQILQTTQIMRADRPVSILYFSDHAQEVGHNGNFSGHTQEYLSGYTIPMLLWINERWRKRYPQEYSVREFRSDWLDHLVQNLLGIRSRWYRTQYDVLSPNYAPTELVLPKIPQ